VVERARSRSPQVATCVTTFATPGAHPITANNPGDTTHPGATATTLLTVTANPTPLQIALGVLVHLAHRASRGQRGVEQSRFHGAGQQ